MGSFPASAGSDTYYVASVEPGPLGPTGPRLKGEVGSFSDSSLNGTGFNVGHGSSLSHHLNKERARKFFHGHPYPRVVAKGTRNMESLNITKVTYSCAQNACSSKPTVEINILRPVFTGIFKQIKQRNAHEQQTTRKQGRAKHCTV